MKKKSKEKAAAKGRAGAGQRAAGMGPKKAPTASQVKKPTGTAKVTRGEPGMKSEGSKETSMRAPKQTLSARQRELFKRVLLSMRERLNGQMNSLKNDSLASTDWINTEEDGTDVFERQFALNIVSSENEMLLEIDDALDRIEKGTYGVCEECSGMIHDARMKALPFVKTCIECQSKLEKGTRLRPPLTLKEV